MKKLRQSLAESRGKIGRVDSKIESKDRQLLNNVKDETVFWLLSKVCLTEIEQKIV